MRKRNIFSSNFFKNKEIKSSTPFEQLVRNYCSRQNVIPLVVTKTDTDVEMDVGFGLVKELGKIDSTIFVFTKADMLVSQVRFFDSLA